MSFHYIFGPVLSRRLGLSLGVDVIPQKTCNLNCVYCESGKTTISSLKRESFIPVDKIIEELDTFLKGNPKLDHITFSGAGEPTLYKDLPVLVTFLKANYPDYKIALITNSILISQPEIRKELLRFDVILPSLDAASDNVFYKINRPVVKIDYSNVIKGLVSFRKQFKGKIWLELFIIEGINDTIEELSQLKKILQRISPDIIQLNTLDRPGTESWVKPASWKRLEEIKTFFKPLSVEIVAREIYTKHVEIVMDDIEQQIVNIIKRRPCTSEELAVILGIEPSSLEKHLSSLLKNNIITANNQSGIVFYKLLSEK